MATEHITALKGMAICRALSAPELEVVAAIIERRQISAGGDVFREGEPGDGLFLVVSGEISVTKRGPAGEHSLARLGASGVLGEMSLVTSEPRSATGRALVETQVLYLPAVRFRALLEANSIAAHKMVAAIADVLARRLATMNGMVLQLAENPGSAGEERARLKTQDLAALHRTMQVWSF